ncbi:MAG: hypothetical protein ABIK76_05550 [candidate division WOR-3 bacterium]
MEICKIIDIIYKLIKIKDGEFIRRVKIANMVMKMRRERLLSER